VSSLYMGLTGQKDCGCFGIVKVNPWITFIFDIACVTILVLTRPHYPSSALLRTLTVVVGLGGAALAAIGFANAPAGEEWIYRLRGHAVTLTPASQDIGEAEEGAIREIRVTVHNRSQQNLTITGASSSCSCVATGGLPLVLAAHGTADINIEVTFKGSPGQFVRQFEFFTDYKGQQDLHGQIRGTVAEPQP
jgi:hypothetical protein